MDELGVTSQLSMFVCALVVATVLVALGPLLQYMPMVSARGAATRKPLACSAFWL